MVLSAEGRLQEAVDDLAIGKRLLLCALTAPMLRASAIAGEGDNVSRSVRQPTSAATPGTTSLIVDDAFMTAKS
jgi:hypothetical protein